MPHRLILSYFYLHSNYSTLVPVIVVEGLLVSLEILLPGPQRFKLKVHVEAEAVPGVWCAGSHPSDESVIRE